MGLVDDLGDGYFAEISDFYHRLVKDISDDFSEKPTLDDVIELTLWGIRSLPENSLEDTSPARLESLRPKLKSKRNIRLSEGDLIAIPVSSTHYAFGVFLGMNTFGYAYGIFEGTHVLRPKPRTAALKPLLAAYSGREFVIEGKWPRLGNYPELAAVFDGPPPIYHAKRHHPDNESIGPYGSEESPSGELRALSKKEAESIGLTDQSYSFCRLEEEFEEYLASKV